MGLVCFAVWFSRRFLENQKNLRENQQTKKYQRKPKKQSGKPKEIKKKKEIHIQGWVLNL